MKEGIRRRGRPNNQNVPYTLELSSEDSLVIEEEASRLNLTRTELVYRIVQICIDDNLFNAILDTDPCPTKPLMKQS